MKCADFWKLNFKILDKNFTIVILYIKNQIVWKTMKCADFEVKFRNSLTELKCRIRTVLQWNFKYKEVNCV